MFGNKAASNSLRLADAMRALFLCMLLASVGLAAYAMTTSSQATQIKLEWTTASEVNTAGFNVYRSDTVDGAYNKINSQLISASTDPLSGGKYWYEDTQVVPGQMYYYQLEDIEFSGKSTRHGPLVVTAPSTFQINYVVWILLGLGALVGLGCCLYYVHRRRERVA